MEKKFLKLEFKTDWQYTPFLDGEELKEGEVVDLFLTSNPKKIYEGLEIGINKKVTNIKGVNIERKLPFAAIEPVGNMPLTPSNCRIKRSNG